MKKATKETSETALITKDELDSIFTNAVRDALYIEIKSMVQQAIHTDGNALRKEVGAYMKRLIGGLK
jgi:hypothetical protein